MKTAQFACLSALALLTSAAAEEKCPPLKLVTSIQMVPDRDGTAEYVPMELGGTPQFMLLDTGAGSSAVSKDLVEQLKLSTYRSNVRVYSVTGEYFEEMADVPAKLGNMPGKLRLVVKAIGRTTEDGVPVAGLLGSDILSNFDVSIDFGPHTLDLIDKNHCDGKVVYWPTRPLAILPFTQLGHPHILVDVLLDGERLTAMLDTGATYSALLEDAAVDKFGIKPGSDDTPEVGSLNGRADLKVYEHRFHTLAFGDGGVTVSNPELLVIPDQLTRHFDGPAPLGSNIRRDDAFTKFKVILGMNVLRHLHVYIAYDEKRLYITPAATASSQTATPPASEPAKTN